MEKRLKEIEGGERQLPSLADWRVPYKPQLPSAQQVATMLALLSLVGPMAMGGMPVIPVTFEDERRRQQVEITQTSESTVGMHQASVEAETALTASQRRLARVTGEIEGMYARDVRDEDVVQAAHRVLSDEVNNTLSTQFKIEFNHVINNTVDVCILRDNEDYEQRTFGTGW